MGGFHTEELMVIKIIGNNSSESAGVNLSNQHWREKRPKTRPSDLCNFATPNSKVCTYSVNYAYSLSIGLRPGCAILGLGLSDRKEIPSEMAIPKRMAGHRACGVEGCVMVLATTLTWGAVRLSSKEAWLRFNKR